MKRMSIAGALALAGMAMAVPAVAHHGWGWAENEISSVEGTIDELYFGPPHAALRITVDGEPWFVEMTPPAFVARTGFTEGVATPGQTVTAIGNRARSGERHMKAIRLIVDGNSYDVYPERIPDDLDLPG